MYRQLLVIAGGLAVLASSTFAQQDPANNWCETTTSKVAAFLPKPAPGLVAHEAWAANEENKLEKTCGDAVQNWKYLKARAEQSWWFDDSVLTQQIAAAQKDKADAQQQGQKDIQARTAEVQALQKQYVDLVAQHQMTEAQATAEKMQKLTSAGDAKVNELDDKIRGLQGRSRMLQIMIHGNEALADALAPEGQRPQPSGTIKGHSVYRVTSKVLGGPSAPEVFLAIYLGPEGFRNPAVEVPSVTAGPKCFTVLARVQPRADTVQADEAVARKMLEAIDLDGLAKLIQP
ncbi:MAG TPA: hypothetical protein VJN89_09690 [Candidatus Acidoferrum sp.]|nr:hypothetical protein [Candidatus Acidoferrum sp.]